MDVGDLNSRLHVCTSFLMHWAIYLALATLFYKKLGFLSHLRNLLSSQTGNVLIFLGIFQVYLLMEIKEVQFVANCACASKKALGLMNTRPL